MSKIGFNYVHVSNVTWMLLAVGVLFAAMDNLGVDACKEDKECTTGYKKHCVESKCVECKLDGDCKTGVLIHCEKNACVECKQKSDCGKLDCRRNRCLCSSHSQCSGETPLCEREYEAGECVSALIYNAMRN